MSDMLDTVAVAADWGRDAAARPRPRFQATMSQVAVLMSARSLLGWEPRHPGLIADIEQAGYFTP
jgi:hypothetical protein